MNVLMHICCSNCALYPFKQLEAKGFKLKGLWFNPNIHREEEYSLRLKALKQLESLWRLDVDYEDRYGLVEFLKALEGHEGVRCEACYRVRLAETASRAKDGRYDAFSTTLLVSPYQKHDLIVEIGKQLQDKTGVEFYYEDFRPGYRDGVKMSRELGLYRQGYCGCIYSKQEREEQKRQKMARAGAK